MTSGNTSRESQRVIELANEYAQKGYSVSLPRHPKDSPAFLRALGYTPDLIAKNKNETLIVEVRSRETAAMLASLSSIAERVNAKPRWRFVLVFTNPRDANTERPRPTPDKVARLLEKSESMGFETQPHTEAAFLFAWAALEAALAASPPMSSSPRKSSAPGTLIRDATMNGLLARRDAHALDRLFKTRNALLHAGDTISPSQADVEHLRRITVDLMRQR